MKTIPLISEIITELQKLFNQNENKKKTKIIFEKKNHFRSNSYVETISNLCRQSLGIPTPGW